MKYKLSYRFNEKDDDGEIYGVTIYEDVEKNDNIMDESYIESIYATTWEDARKKAIEYLKELQKMPKDEVIDINNE